MLGNVLTPLPFFSKAVLLSVPIIIVSRKCDQHSDWPVDREDEWTRSWHRLFL